MPQRILDRDARALRETDDENLLWTQAPTFARIEHQPVAAFHRPRKLRLIGFEGVEGAARVTQAAAGVRRDPAHAPDVEGTGQIEHLLFRTGTAVQEDAGPVGGTPG